MKRVVSFGEIMVRLSPPGYLKIIQADSFTVNYTGAEANVCVSLANLGMPAEFVTKLPDNSISTTTLATLRKYGVILDHIVLGGDRMGLYYLERGASQRPSKIIYDRKYSSVSMSKRDDYDWDSILDGAGWFHFTGITAALSDCMPLICKDACESARKKGITISCDLNYRKALWSVEKAVSTMSELVSYCDVVIGNEEDAKNCLNIVPREIDVTSGKLNYNSYVEVAQAISSRFGASHVAFTLRSSHSASDNTWAGVLYTGKKAYFSKNYEIHLVDRVGGGDSFSSGIIYSLASGKSPQYTIEFAAAISCLKQATEQDFSLSSISDVEMLMSGDGSGRVQR